MIRPTDEEYAAAVERERVATAAALEANKAMLSALEEATDASAEVLRLGALRRDLEEMLLDDMTRLETRNGRPWTVRQLARRTYRDEATVRTALGHLVALGELRQVGQGWEVAS